MCRLFACAGPLSEHTVITSLKIFRKVAKIGIIPPVPGIKRGHTEGWGLVAYRKGDIVYEKKRKAFAYKDPEFLHSIPRMAARKPDIVIAHVRKMTYGMVASRNNHPFVFGHIAFAHNGSVDGTEHVPVKSYFKDSIRGTTDSERLFAYFLQMLYKKKSRGTDDVRSCLKQTITYIHKHHDYTAFNVVVSNSTHVWAYRDYNPDNALVKKYDLGTYFTLFHALQNGVRLFVSSEKMDIANMSWKLLENKMGVEYDVRTHGIKSFKI